VACQYIRNNSADSSRWLVSTSGLICFRSGERNITNSDLDEPAAEYLKANIGHGSSGHIRSMLQKWGTVQIDTPELCELRRRVSDLMWRESSVFSMTMI